jgi:hypothetical protein
MSVRDKVEISQDGKPPRCTTAIAERDLERYHLGLIPEGPELDALEEHLLSCHDCNDHAEEVQIYVDAMRAGLVKGNLSKAIEPGTGAELIDRLLQLYPHHVG